jgi:acetyl-CoA C-acetyltransferase
MREEDAGDRTILGRIVDYAVAGTEPRIMGYTPVFALQRLFERAPIRQSDVGVVELNEAFAAQAVAVIRDAGLDPEVVNPIGGAIALGHPVGATGAILTLRALYHMRRNGIEWGVVTMCVGGGQGVAMLLCAT